MPTLTTEAARFLEDALERAQRSDAAARLTRAKSGWGLQIDSEKEGDEVVENDGHVVLVMAEEVAEHLGDAVIDLDDTQQGPKLVIRQG